MDRDQVRRALLEAVQEVGLTPDGLPREFERHVMFNGALAKLPGAGSKNVQHALLEAWDQLFREGVVSYGSQTLPNPNYCGMHWARLTEHGFSSMRQLSRDPGNPAGYKAALQPYVATNSIAWSYVVEGLDTYIHGNFKAAAVMLGCAAEALHLDLRDVLVTKMTTVGEQPSAALANLDAKVLTIIREIEKTIDVRIRNASRGAMPRDLRETFTAYWSAWTGVIRMTRNEAGHPSGVDPVSRDRVQGNYILFHDQAKLSFDLGDWIKSSY